MQDSVLKKPENTQISEDNSDNFDVSDDTPISQEQKEIESDDLKENQRIPEKTSLTVNEHSISDSILSPIDASNNASAENNEEKIETEISAQKPAKEVKKIADARDQEQEEPAQKDLLGADGPLEKLDLEKEKVHEILEKPKPELEVIKNSQEKIKNNRISPRVIIQEKIIRKELSEEEIKKLYKKILLEHLKNARKKRRAAYENNLKLIGQKNSNEKFTPKSVAKDLKVSRRTASRYLRKLFKQGKIMRFGAGKKLFYQVYPVKKSL